MSIQNFYFEKKLNFDSTFPFFDACRKGDTERKNVDQIPNFASVTLPPVCFMSAHGTEIFGSRGQSRAEIVSTNLVILMSLASKDIFCVSSRVVTLGSQTRNNSQILLPKTDLM